MVCNVTGVCSECGLTCEGKTMDFGIGPYEYWGANYVDTQLALVSHCCEAPMVDEIGNEMVLEDYQDEPM